MFKNIILPASLLAGTIIGAGVFALPYVFEKAGLLTGLFYLIIFSVVFCVVHLMYADIIVRTEFEIKEKHRFVGYAEHYLGSIGKWTGILTIIFGMVFYLVIYLMLSKNFIGLFLPALAENWRMIIFWLLGSTALFWKIDRLAVVEFCISFGIVLAIIAIFFLGFQNFSQTVNLSLFNISSLFLPYGIVLFAMVGRVAVPGVLAYFILRNKPVSLVKKPIIFGTLAPACLYILFIIGILGLSVNGVSKDSVSGLVGNLPFTIVALLGLFSILAMWSTYMIVSREIKKSLQYDLKFPEWLGATIAALLPLALCFLIKSDFLKVMSIVGGVFIGIESLFVVLIWLKASKKTASPIKILPKLPRLFAYSLTLVFIGGIIYEIISGVLN